MIVSKHLRTYQIILHEAAFCGIIYQNYVILHLHIIRKSSPMKTESNQIPYTDSERIAALKEYKIMDSSPEEEFDNITKLASYICQAPISLITLLDEERQWFKSKIGVAISETPREHAFCNHTIQQNDLMIIEDAQKDERFKDNPLVLEDPNIRFYAGMSLTSPKGYNLGSLCVIDRVPRKLDEQQIFALRTLARQVINQMELRKQNFELIKVLDEVYEQNQNLKNLNDFNRKLQSIVSHDLRNPINATRHFLNFISSGELNSEEIMTWSYSIGKSLELSERLLNNMIDLGVSSFKNDEQHKEEIELHEYTQNIVDEILPQAQLKRNQILNYTEKITFRGNPHLLDFILRNLLQNANKFTHIGTIIISSESTEDTLILRIKDNGKGMRQDELEGLFQFEINHSNLGTDGEKGSGLGLNICHDFVLRMKGRIWAESEEGKGSIFNIELPL